MMRRVVLALFTTAFLLIGMTLSAGAQADSGNDGIDTDCNNKFFTSVEQARAYFANDGGSAARNVDDLDRNRDGVACDSGIKNVGGNGSQFPGGSTGTTSGTDNAAINQIPPEVPAQQPVAALAPAQLSSACADFDAWEWAQSVFESDPQKYDALDPDNDGIACPELPPGFAPAFWTDKIPKGVQEAEMVRIIDGDTFEVLINGVSNRIRIYRADTPETQNEKHCGGAEATAFADWVLSFNDNPGEVYIEKDKNEKDRYGRKLAYVWFEVDGNPYLLNHVLINNGYAEDVDYGDRKYDQQLKDAAAFAERHQLGVWALCDPDGPSGESGPWGLPVPAPAAVSLPAEPAPAVPQPINPAPVPAQPDTALPVEGPPVEEPPVEELPSDECDPNYTPCVPLVSYDLDCPDIGFSVTIIGSDRHDLDGNDNDGYGCE